MIFVNCISLESSFILSIRRVPNSLAKLSIVTFSVSGYINEINRLSNTLLAEESFVFTESAMFEKFTSSVNSISIKAVRYITSGISQSIKNVGVSRFLAIVERSDAVSSFMVICKFALFGSISFSSEVLVIKTCFTSMLVDVVFK